MCGIIGIFPFKNREPLSEKELLRMVGALSHRGPDESGIYLDDSIGMGHARLAIIDLETGTQPMGNEDGSLRVVLNGEIFNYLELKDRLEENGHTFRTKSDTEVLLHLFEDEGISCVEKLNGQFAFAIWDAKKSELYLGRDRFGICPLNYALMGGRFIFASEVKALFTARGTYREIDPCGIDQAFTFWSTLPGKTVFKHVYQVPPGHFVKVSENGIVTKRYWEIPFGRGELDDSITAERAAEEIIGLLRDSCRLRLRSDVPVGGYLSGGLDSSGVASLVKKEFVNSLTTFGITFEDGAFDEKAYQESLLPYLEVDHVRMHAENGNISASIPDVVWHCETPLLRTAPVPLYLLSKEVNRHGLKAVLTGEGADEIFAGYNIFREAKIRAFWARQPESRIRPLLLNKIYPYVFHDEKSRAYSRLFFGKGFEDISNPLYTHLLRWENTRRLCHLYSPDMKEAVGGYSPYVELNEKLPGSFSDWDALTRAQYLELYIFMGNYLLTSQGDRVSMGNSVETRPVYLDHRLAGFMAKVPPGMRMQGIGEKILLKKALKGYLPESIIQREKMPYRAPVRGPLMNGFAGHLRDYLSKEAIGRPGIFDYRNVSLLLKKMENPGKASEVDEMGLAGVLTTQILFHQFMEKFPYREIKPAEPDILIDKRQKK